LAISIRKNKKEDVAYFEVAKSDIKLFDDLVFELAVKLGDTNEGELFFYLMRIIKPASSKENLILSLEKNSVVMDVLDYCLSLRNKIFFTDDAFLNELILKKMKIKSHFYKENYFKINEDVSLRRMIQFSVEQITEYLEENIRPSEKQLVGVCYKALSLYNEIKLPNFPIEKLSHYTLTVLTGLILLRFKPKLLKSNKRDLTLDSKLTKPLDISDAFIKITNFYK